jgi:hypothetical protein
LHNSRNLSTSEPTAVGTASARERVRGACPLTRSLALAVLTDGSDVWTSGP